MGIGSNVKRYRTKLGMDQKTLATKLGVTAGAVSNYENDVSAPKEEVLYKMFEVLNVTPDELFAGCYSETKKSPAPEGTEDEEQGISELEDELRSVLLKHGILTSGDITREQSEFLKHIFALILAFFKD